jgi:hypothetical protein
MTSQRVPDVVSPIEDKPLPNRVPADDARAAGRFGYDKPTVGNSIVLLIDHQIGLMASTRDTRRGISMKPTPRSRV